MKMMSHATVLVGRVHALVHMVQEPDALDIASLYRRYAPAVHRRALKLLADEQEALDVMQETFLAYFKQKSTWRREASAFTILYQIATYQSFDRLRKKARWTGKMALPETKDAEENQPISETPDGITQVEAAADLALLTKGEEAEVLTAALLYFVEGYTTEEIGQTLEVSRKTVGTMLAGFSERAQKRYARLTPKDLK